MVEAETEVNDKIDEDEPEGLPYDEDNLEMDHNEELIFGDIWEEV